jgi:hypothetical protein
MARWLCALLLLLAGAVAARAAGPEIAQVKSVVGKVTVVRGGAKLPVKVGDPLYQSDVIETGGDGGIGLTFIDNTMFSAGPGSEIALSEFTFDSNNFRGRMLADLRHGSLAVTSGDIAHSGPGAMRIETPRGILGVRGTTFAVKVY